MLASLALALGLAGAAVAQPPAPPPLPASLQRPTTQTSPTSIQTVGGQGASRDSDPADKSGYRISLDPPGTEVLFRLDSEAALQERIRQEFKQQGLTERLVFPEEPVLSKHPYYGRNWPATQMMVEPHYVCHGRLPFEELNSERYGWELGVLQPIVSTAHFWKDFVLLPYHLGTRPCQQFDCSKGKCLPGDPVPLMCYPPELSLTGAAYQAAAVGLLVLMFP